MPQLYSSNTISSSYPFRPFLYFLFNHKRLVSFAISIYFFPLNKIEIIHVIYNQQQRYKFEQATARTTDAIHSLLRIPLRGWSLLGFN